MTKENKSKFRMSPIGGIMIMMIVLMIFIGMSTALVNLNFIETNKATRNTNELISSNNRTNTIINEVRDFQHFINERDENQTAELLPIFMKNFNQTNELVNATNDLKDIIPDAASAINNVTSAINFLAKNFGPDTGYIERENFQYGQSNSTANDVKEIKELIINLTDTLNRQTN